MNPNKQALYNKVAEALNGKPSEQPVHTTANSGDGENNQKKASSKAGMSRSQFRQKGSPTKSYSVAAINKAKARLG